MGIGSVWPSRGRGRSRDIGSGTNNNNATGRDYVGEQNHSELCGDSAFLKVLPDLRGRRPGRFRPLSPNCCSRVITHERDWWSAYCRVTGKPSLILFTEGLPTNRAENSPLPTTVSCFLSTLAYHGQAFSHS